MDSSRKRILRAALFSAVAGVSPFAFFSAVAHANALPGVVQVQQENGRERVTARLRDGSELVIEQAAPGVGANMLVRKEDRSVPAETGDYTLASGHTLHLRQLPTGAADWVVSNPTAVQLAETWPDYSRMIRPTSPLDWFINLVRGGAKAAPPTSSS